MKKKDFGFAGVFLPADIFLSDKLLWTEKILWSVIQGLDKEDGCYASNEYLADCMKLNHKWVSKTISKLKNLGMVIQEGFDGRKRVLRVLFDSQKNSGKVSGEGIGRPRREAGADPLSDEKGIGRPRREAGADPAVRRSLLPLDDLNSISKKERSSQKISDLEFFRSFAELLAQEIGKKRKYSITEKKLKQWTQSFYNLTKEDGVQPDRIKKVLRWFIRHMGEEYIPQVSTGMEFRSKFLKIEDARQRVFQDRAKIENKKNNSKSKQTSNNSTNTCDDSTLTEITKYCYHFPERLQKDESFLMALGCWWDRSIDCVVKLLDSDVRERKWAGEWFESDLTCDAGFSEVYGKWVRRVVGRGFDLSNHSVFFPGGKMFEKWENEWCAKRDMKPFWREAV